MARRLTNIDTLRAMPHHGFTDISETCRDWKEAWIWPHIAAYSWDFPHSVSTVFAVSPQAITTHKQIHKWLHRDTDSQRKKIWSLLPVLSRTNRIRTAAEKNNMTALNRLLTLTQFQQLSPCEVPATTPTVNKLTILGHNKGAYACGGRRKKEQNIQSNLESKDVAGF